MAKDATNRGLARQMGTQKAWPTAARMPALRSSDSGSRSRQWGWEPVLLLGYSGLKPVQRTSFPDIWRVLGPESKLMTTVGETRASIEDLYHIPQKAELIGGRIVSSMPTGFLPNLVASNIFISLRGYQKQVGGGVACNDNLRFVVPELSSGRESFCPDAAYFRGELPENRMGFVEGAPTLAIEVRCEGDYGPTGEAEMAAKRADYFEAGTLVVWDVDPLAEQIHGYRLSIPTIPTPTPVNMRSFSNVTSLVN
jgi:Uma2 family endonuclease